MPTCIHKELIWGKTSFWGNKEKSWRCPRALLCCMCVCFNRRSYVGVELVQWLCEQCVYVRCRTTAVRVWQVLLELGVLLSGKPHAYTLTRLEVIPLNLKVTSYCHLRWLHICKEPNIEVDQQIICKKKWSHFFFPFSSWSKMTKGIHALYLYKKNLYFCKKRSSLQNNLSSRLWLYKLLLLH